MLKNSRMLSLSVLTIDGGNDVVDDDLVRDAEERQVGQAAPILVVAAGGLVHRRPAEHRPQLLLRLRS